MQRSPDSTVGAPPTIVVGLGGDASPEHVEAFADAGAGELFVGYVPAAWSSRFGSELSPNRRYRLGQQLTDIDALAAVVGAASARGLSVQLTLNEHALLDEQCDLVDALVREAVGAGVHGLILAALEYGPRFKERHPDLHLTASGDAPVYSVAALRLAVELGFDRVIFGRETSLDDMARMVAVGVPLGMTFEAFVLGEWCVYNGALCLTCHGYGHERDFCSSHTVRAVLDTGAREAGLDRPAETEATRRAALARVTGRMRPYMDGCALCALPRLAEIGVTHVKVPGRSFSALPAVRLVHEILSADELSPAACQATVADPAFCDGGNCRVEPHPILAAEDDEGRS